MQARFRISERDYVNACLLAARISRRAWAVVALDLVLVAVLAVWKLHSEFSGYWWSP